ncbi:unnamed protein product [Bursaphelenchus xylophilus]|uniref:(pine wood nematode) hypothetical protein n=1 Tax=Bursaphelenchus xylophilus TaxID=6326 RepID=A0A1I7S423_BURXY|nr:unnamed protein product [Bursaphelenchus xylophilus]CAG9116644.1 unnamed protein product [Bursaphelenchus xylophilus]
MANGKRKPNQRTSSKGKGVKSKGGRSECSRISEVRSKVKRKPIIIGGSTPATPSRERLETREQVVNCRRIVDYIMDMGIDKMAKEYNTEIKPFVPPTTTKLAFEANPDKNRYPDVICGDQDRVILSLDDGVGDYIHANFVKGWPLVNPFICTQGPTENTVIDFYRMITQQNVGNIFMLCEIIECKKVKCYQYWPTEEAVDLEFGGFKIHLKEAKRENRTVTSDLTITCPRGVFDVKHYLWLQWPDRGIPDTTKCPLRLLKLSRKESRPTVVHCSAGIGRTGSLVAIEYVIQSIMALSPKSFPEMIKDVRSHRVLAVQTDIQYVYIARCVLQFYDAYGPEEESVLYKFDHPPSKNEIK